MIENFKGDYAFLSNFYPSPLVYQGITYPTAEHAYQAQKTDKEHIKRKIASLPTPGQAKRYGAKIDPLPDFWANTRESIMYQIVAAKFADPELAALLLSTGDEFLIESNNWGDTYWGRCNNVGDNRLGRILMSERNRIRYLLDCENRVQDPFIERTV
jgi:ribA/ribD-fused uncharacterized protein